MNSHDKALNDHNQKMIKQTTSLHAQLNHVKKEHESFKSQVHNKLENIIRTYDSHFQKVDDYLSSNGLISKEHLEHIRSLYPIKLK
jgi:hypothetical protein